MSDDTPFVFALQIHLEVTSADTPFVFALSILDKRLHLSSVLICHGKCISDSVLFVADFNMFILFFLKWGMDSSKFSAGQVHFTNLAQSPWMNLEIINEMRKMCILSMLV